jgi:hypothetical protein
MPEARIVTTLPSVYGPPLTPDRRCALTSQVFPGAECSVKDTVTT